MPIDPITAAAGITALANTANAAATGQQNRKSRQFSRETYAKTKADNIQFGICRMNIIVHKHKWKDLKLQD